MPSMKRHKPSSATRVISSTLTSDPGIITITAITILGVYLFDSITPLGEPVWLLYFIPLVLSFWSNRISAIPVVCIVIMLFLTAGFFVSPPGIAANYAIVSRLTFSLIFVGAAIVLWAIRRRQIQEDRL